MKEFLDKYRILIGVITATVVLLTTVGYNVKASLPPTRNEVVEMLIPLSEALDSTLILAQSNTDWIKLQEFDRLVLKHKQNGGLDSNDQRRLCILASELIMLAPGCR
jgi:hypothetical protein